MARPPKRLCLTSAGGVPGAVAASQPGKPDHVMADCAWRGSPRPDSPSMMHTDLQGIAQYPNTELQNDQDDLTSHHLILCQQGPPDRGHPSTSLVRADLAPACSPGLEPAG